jgi:transcription initiation factor TFIIIB Brf1 subunit/transcription initiation factor TFIIB
VSTKERPVGGQSLSGDGSRETCAVCGITIESRDIEDTNGWRWFNDGQGGLRPLCPSCPLPEVLLATDAE